MLNFRWLINRETDILEKIAPGLLPAENSLLVGSADFAPLLLRLNAKYHYFCNDQLSNHQSIDSCLAHYHELPFEPNSMDIILLPHTLEQTDKPGLVLEEATSILAPNGHLILLSSKKFSTIKLGLNKQPLTTLSLQHFALPFSGLREPWERYAERCLPFLCQAYILIAKKIVHSPLTRTPAFARKTQAFTLREKHVCSRDIH